MFVSIVKKARRKIVCPSGYKAENDRSGPGKEPTGTALVGAWEFRLNAGTHR